MVESWISDMGFKVRSEVDVEQYRADLVISELGMVVEIDGPSHRKLKKNGSFVSKTLTTNISKRDNLLLGYYPNGIWHIPVGIDEETFKVEFKRIIGELADEKRTE
jgi:hypothetical protein